MENIEIMNEGMECAVEEIVADNGSCKNPGLAFALIVLGTAAVCAAIGFGKKAWDKHKAKKELRKPEKEIHAEPEDIEEVVAK